ncbi:ANTAR domain-containing protein [Streptomyces minutiscleroticus]|uniref:ANTAR domain-containing protein n=1 Tax=Streptomyces minutiscleroticus TaxID=68238 RepID=UPI00331DEC9E
MGSGNVLPELLDGLAQVAGVEERRRWAVRCARVLDVEGVAASLGEQLVWFSNTTSARLAEVQFTLGQGPGLEPDQDQDLGRVPRQITDLQAEAGQRWPQYALEAQALGVRAVFIWPLRAGAARMGTLTGYRGRPGPLTGRQAREGLQVADVLAIRLLAWQPGCEATPGETGTAGAVELHWAEVHQATGVLCSRLRIPPQEALARLRAQAFAESRPLIDLARDLLAQLPP